MPPRIRQMFVMPMHVAQLQLFATTYMRPPGWEMLQHHA